MSNQNLKPLQGTALMLMLALAPAVQAQSRDTAVGPMIAAQGNQALRVIRAEVRSAWLAPKPALPKPVPAKASAPAGTASSVAATVRCAG